MENFSIMSRESTRQQYLRIVIRYDEVCKAMGELAPYVSEMYKKELVAKLENVKMTTVYRAMRQQYHLMKDFLKLMP